MYIPFHARVLVFRSFCTSLRTRTRVPEDARARDGRTCARDIRGYQSYAKLQTETAPLQPLPSLFPEGQICIHTTSHTTRFNISGHGWKLSPETQADARGTIGLANAAIFAIAPVSGVSRRKRDC